MHNQSITKISVKIKCAFCLLFLFSFFNTKSSAQDLKKVLTLDDFFNVVLQNHPLAKQANLLTQVAKQNLVVARGGFDPYFFSNLYQRQYDGQEYLFLNKSGFKVPLWYGIDISGSYNINRGELLNPEHSMPAEGRAVLGISAPIGQGLFMDERRSVLKQAQIFREASEFERIGMLNDLLFRSTKDYWDWTMHYNNYIILNTALTAAQERFEGFRNSFKFGEIPAIDTVEAFTQLQNIQFNLNEALLNYRNTSLTLSNHLWLENEVPIELTDAIIPPSLDAMNFNPKLTLDSIAQITNSIAQYHPDIKQMQLKINQLDIERRLKLEYLKPKINVNYNLLSREQFAFNTDPQTGNPFNTNYKWGFDIAFPLLWNQGRGNYKLAKLKIQDAEYKLDLKNVEVANKIKTYFNELIILKDQVTLYQDATNNYARLLSAEIIKFEAGESSIFLINARQMKLIEFQSKLLEVKTKYLKALAGVAWASGTLYRNGN